MAPADQARGDELRCLLFSAERHEKAGEVRKAQEALCQLLELLEAESQESKESAWLSEGLRAEGSEQLVSLQSHPETLKAMERLSSEVLSVESNLQGLQLDIGSDITLEAYLRQDELFDKLLSDELACKLKAAGLMQAEGSSSSRKVQPKQQRGRQLLPSARGAGPITKDQKLERQGLADPVKRKRSFSPPQAAVRNPDGSPSATTSESLPVRGCQRERWASHHTAGTSEREPFVKLVNNRNTNLETGVESSPPKRDDGGFFTAKAVLVAEERKKGGKGFNARDYSSGSMFPDAQPLFRKRPTRAPQAAPGLGNTQPSAPAGPRGAFVPPFVKKAMEPQKGDQQEGTLSSKTLEVLSGPDGSLPEALQRVEPHILELVCSEILDRGSGVQWDDIAGQADAKRLVQELVVWPMLNPELFTGARAPPKGLLLFGPPGTGKTLIGRAIASNIQATFFNISAGSLTSKWIGEGEKMVRALFAVAAVLQPAVIFMDEIDSVLSARKAEGEHEASRRLKTELLVQMEGVDPSSTDGRILLVGATNRPEELDEAARRRMPKQLYIPLPCETARESMLRRQLGHNHNVRADLPDADIAKIVAHTAGYSGSDMRNLIQEACQGPVRDAVTQHGAGVANLRETDLRPVVLRDFQLAARAQRASVQPSEVVRYQEYDTKHGARYVDPHGVGNGTGMEEEAW